MNTTKQWLAYSVYFIIVIVFFLYTQFPSDTVEKYIINNLSRAVPDYRVSMERIKPSFLPIGVKLYNVNLDSETGPALHFETLKINPGLFSLLGKTPIVSFKGEIYQGTVKGKIEFAETIPSGPVAVDAKLSGIHVEKITWLELFFSSKMAGILGGTIAYGSDKTARTNLTLNDLSVELATPLLNMKNLTLHKLTFKTIEAKAELKRKRLQVKKINFTGDQANGDISGFIMLRSPVGKSHLNLNGTVTPSPAFLEEVEKNIPFELGFLFGNTSGENGFPFRIKGTFDKPDFSIK